MGNENETRQGQVKHYKKQMGCINSSTLSKWNFDV